MKLSHINESYVPTPAEVSQRMQAHFAQNKGVKAATVPASKNSGNNDWHGEQDRAEHGRPVNVSKNGSEMREDSSDFPEEGNNIRTNNGKMEGKVIRVDGDVVYFKLADGRPMKTSIRNVTVIEKLADEDDEMMEGGMGGINRCAPSNDVSYQ